MGHAAAWLDALPRGALLSLAGAAGSQASERSDLVRCARDERPCRIARDPCRDLLAAWLDLEVASGNDAIASHSPTGAPAKLMGQFLPGTDFVTSGWSVMPRYDNMFGGGNYDADDIDEWRRSSATAGRRWHLNR